MAASARQTFLQQRGDYLVEVGSLFGRQRLDLRDEVAIEFDGERNQAKCLVATALLAAIDYHRSLAEFGATGNGHFAHQFFGVVFRQIGLSHGVAFVGVCGEGK